MPTVQPQIVQTPTPRPQIVQTPAPTPAPYPSAETLEAQAHALLQQGRPAQALVLLQQAREQTDTPRPRTQSLTGTAHRLSGDPAAALPHHDAALAADDNAEHRVERALSRRSAGDIVGATEDALTALQLEDHIHPGYHTGVEAHRLMAQHHMQANQPRQALLHAGRAAQIARAHGYAQEDQRSLDLGLQTILQAVGAQTDTRTNTPAPPTTMTTPTPPPVAGSTPGPTPPPRDSSLKPPPTPGTTPPTQSETNTSTPIPKPTLPPTATPTPTKESGNPAPPPPTPNRPVTTPTPTPTGGNGGREGPPKPPPLPPTATPTPTEDSGNPAPPPNRPVNTPTPTPTGGTGGPGGPPQPPPPRTDGPLTSLTGATNASWLESHHPETAQRVAALPWVADHTNAYEEKILSNIIQIFTHRHSPATTRVLDMPFLQSPSSGDREAAHSLMRINAWSHTTFDEILSHPAISEAGIHDRHTPVIATLWDEIKNQPGSHAIILDPAKTEISRATINLPISGAVQVTLIRTGPDPDRDIMARTLQALRINEAFHGEPLRTDSVNVIVTPNLPGTLAGQNSSTHIAIDQAYERHGGDRLLSLMVHEVAHYYWYGMLMFYDSVTC